jgi:Ca2+-binding RTX toxin-like protein
VLNADKTVTYTPAANFNGDDSFTYRVGDGYSVSSTATVTIRVAAVNDAPTIAIWNDPVSGIGQCPSTGVTATLNLALADVDTSGGNLTLSATSSNAAAVPEAGITFGGSGQSRTVTITATSGATVRSATITVQVDDGAGGLSSIQIDVYLGTSSSNRISAGNRTSVLLGLGGADTLTSANAPDLICGGGGNDVIDGGNGGDTLRGDDGDDTLRGNAGDDQLTGGAGKDSFEGGSGADRATDRVSGESAKSVEQFGP